MSYDDLKTLVHFIPLNYVKFKGTYKMVTLNSLT